MKTHTKTRMKIVGILVALVAAVVPLFGAGVAWAQGEYEPVTGAAAQQARTDPAPYLLAAYGFIWAVIVLYVISVARGLTRTRTEVAELRKRVEAVTGTGAR